MKWFMLILLISAKALALETDNYITWGRDLSDSREFLNEYLKTEIEEVLRHQNEKDSCSDIRLNLAKRFKSIGVKDNPLENYLVENLPHDAFYPHTFDYVSESIYQNPFMPHLPGFGLSPNIQINGVTLGTDKLSHFASTGFTYYLIYSASLMTGNSEEKATVHALTYGLKDEQSLHGYWASGVFSYADLEANFQGLQFYKHLCTKYLKKLKDQWTLVKVPDIAEYINGHWDESYNRSYFVEKNWEKVKPFLLKYSGMEPRSYTHSKSFSQNYAEKLRAEGKLPVPQKF